MAEGQMNLKQMIDLCYAVTHKTKSQIQIVGHEVRVEYEYIDYKDLTEPHPRPKHRLRKLQGQWQSLY